MIREATFWGLVSILCICMNASLAVDSTGIESFSADVEELTSKYITVKKAVGGTYDGVAAFVNGEAIIIRDVMVSVPNIMRFLYRSNPDFQKLPEAELLVKAYNLALDEAIDRILIIAEYRNGELRIPENAIERLMSETIDMRFGGDMSEMQKMLSELRITYKEWKNRMEENMIVRSMRQSVVTSNTHVSPSEIIAAYKNRKDEFIVHETAHVFMISLVSDDEAGIKIVAENVKKRLDSGESFEDVASEVSNDSYAKQGGDRGWVVPNEEFREEISDAIGALKIGEISQPVFIGTRAYILKKNDMSHAFIPPLKDIQGDIERLLKDEEAERIYKSWVERLRDSAVITIFDPF